MQLFKKYCLLLLMLVMVAQAQQSVPGLYGAASKGDAAELAQLKALGNKGDTAAQTALGFMYPNGTGVPKDAVQAVFWFRKSANQGDASGQFNLGVMYSNGDGVPKDLAQAAFLCRKSADQGNAPAESNLGAMYATGKGVPKDFVIAYMWRNLVWPENSIRRIPRPTKGYISVRNFGICESASAPKLHGSNRRRQNRGHGAYLRRASRSSLIPAWAAVTTARLDRAGEVGHCWFIQPAREISRKRNGSRHFDIGSSHYRRRQGLSPAVSDRSSFRAIRRRNADDVAHPPEGVSGG